MPKRSIRFLIIIGLFGIGLGFMVSALDPLLYSEKSRQLAPTALRNSALSLITIMALLVALIAQPLIGYWSDRTRGRWGPRLPFLTGGVIGLSLALMGIALADTILLLILAAMLASAAANTVQSAWQALVPDYVPLDQRGTATALKTLLEVLGVIAGVAIAGYALNQGWLSLIPVSATLSFGLILLITLVALARTNQPVAPLSRPASPPPGRRRPPNPLADLVAFVQERPPFFWWIINRLLFW